MIPKIIHQWWTGDLPAHIEGWMDEWRRLHPDWSYRLHEDDISGQFDADLKRCWDMVPDLWRADTVARIRSNIVRVWLLSEQGGVWVDADIQPLRPIDPFLVFDGWVPWTSDRSGWYAVNTPWGSAPEHDLVWRCRRDLLAEHQKKAAGWKVDLTGPRYVNDRIGPDTTVLAEYLFNPYSWQSTSLYPIDEGIDFSVIFPDSYTVHHWNYARR